MRDFLVDTALPVVGYFTDVALCIGLLVFAAGVASDIVSSPIEISTLTDD